METYEEIDSGNRPFAKKTSLHRNRNRQKTSVNAKIGKTPGGDHQGIWNTARDDGDEFQSDTSQPQIRS